LPAGLASASSARPAQDLPHGQEFAGHHSGITVQPLTNAVSAAGIEAQCLLALAGFSPGTIDGVFGPTPRRRRRTSSDLSTAPPRTQGSAVDGVVVPQTWPWLRCVSQTNTNVHIYAERRRRQSMNQSLEDAATAMRVAADS